MREHEAILEALRRRAGSELSDILFQHLRNKRSAAVEHLAEGAGAARPQPPAVSLPILNSKSNSSENKVHLIPLSGSEQPVYGSHGCGMTNASPA